MSQETYSRLLQPGGKIDSRNLISQCPDATVVEEAVELLFKEQDVDGAEENKQWVPMIGVETLVQEQGAFVFAPNAQIRKHIYVEFLAQC